MRDVNKVILLGNLGADPELKHTANGVAVVNLRIATNERWKDKESGELNERVTWHTVVAFDKVAEFAAEYLKKGARVYVEGQIQVRKWTNKEGVDQYSTEIRAQDVSGQDRKGEGNETEESPQPARKAPAKASTKPATATAVRRPATKAAPSAASWD